MVIMSKRKPPPGYLKLDSETSMVSGDRKGTDEMASKVKVMERKSPPTADALRKMIASGKSVPSKASAK